MPRRASRDTPPTRTSSPSSTSDRPSSFYRVRNGGGRRTGDGRLRFRPSRLELRLRRLGGACRRKRSGVNGASRRQGSQGEQGGQGEAVGRGHFTHTTPLGGGWFPRTRSH